MELSSCFVQIRWPCRLLLLFRSHLHTFSVVFLTTAFLHTFLLDLDSELLPFPAFRRLAIALLITFGIEYFSRLLYELCDLFQSSPACSTDHVRPCACSGASNRPSFSQPTPWKGPRQPRRSTEYPSPNISQPTSPANAATTTAKRTLISYPERSVPVKTRKPRRKRA